jgi:hypothetical protein
MEAFRHDADDRRRRVVDHHRSTDDAGVGVVSTGPHAVRDYRDARGIEAIVLGAESSPQDRRGPDDVERVDRDEGAHVAMRRQALLAHVHGKLERGDHVRQGARRTPVAHVRIGHAERPLAGVDHAQEDQAIGLVQRKITNHDAVHEGERGGVGPKRERQCQNRGGREPPILEQQPDGEAEVL